MAAIPSLVAPVKAPVSSLPAPRPSWEIRPVARDAKEIPASVYVVQPGDTLRGVADRTGAGSEAIARTNGLSAPFGIRAGQGLAIPVGPYHLDRAGECRVENALAYGVAGAIMLSADASAATQ